MARSSSPSPGARDNRSCGPCRRLILRHENIPPPLRGCKYSLPGERRCIVSKRRHAWPGRSLQPFLRRSSRQVTSRALGSRTMRHKSRRHEAMHSSTIARSSGRCFGKVQRLPEPMIEARPGPEPTSRVVRVKPDHSAVRWVCSMPIERCQCWELGTTGLKHVLWCISGRSRGSVLDGGVELTLVPIGTSVRASAPYIYRRCIWKFEPGVPSYPIYGPHWC